MLPQMSARPARRPVRSITSRVTCRIVENAAMVRNTLTNDCSTPPLRGKNQVLRRKSNLFFILDYVTIHNEKLVLEGNYLTIPAYVN